MDISRKVLVTGGAGFIGSHLVDSLMNRSLSVTVLDNLSSGRLESLSQWLDNRRFTFVKGDLLDPPSIEKSLNECSLVFHMAANPEVRIGVTDTKIDYEQNILATYNLLEALRRQKRQIDLVFASTSTVYGDASVMPTPEDYGPLKPISLYGASKLACESLISGYAHLFGFKAAILRLANIIGPRSTHGVIYDFINKLKANPLKLEVLGDGTQSKSYLHVHDCVEAFIMVAEHLGKGVEIYNAGSNDQVDVMNIARIVVDVMGLEGVGICPTGGVDGGRGWFGDVKLMLLDVSKIMKLGWKLHYTSAEAVRASARAAKI